MSPGLFLADKFSLMREALSALKKEIVAKFPFDSVDNIMSSILFFRFFGPCILYPVKFGIYSEGEGW